MKTNPVVRRRRLNQLSSTRFDDYDAAGQLQLIKANDSTVDSRAMFLKLQMHNKNQFLEIYESLTENTSIQRIRLITSDHDKDSVIALMEAERSVNAVK